MSATVTPSSSDANMQAQYVNTQRQAIDSLLANHQAISTKLTQSYQVFQDRVKREIGEEAEYAKGLADMEQQLLNAGAIAATKAKLAAMRTDMQGLFTTYKKAIAENNAAAEAITTKYDGAMSELVQIQSLMGQMDADIADMLACVADNKRVLHDLPA